MSCVFFNNRASNKQQRWILYYYDGPQIENYSGWIQEENDSGEPKTKNDSDGLLENELQTSASDIE